MSEYEPSQCELLKFVPFVGTVSAKEVVQDHRAEMLLERAHEQCAKSPRISH